MTPALALRNENRLVIAHIYTATAAIALGAVFGVFQGFARAGAFGAPAWFDYYRILTMHGVLMALVFTTFFITGLSLFVTYRSIPRERRLAVAWFGWGLMLLGTAMAALTILHGDATVLYTFYAPLKASPSFYIGATLLVLGTWVVAFEIFENVCFFRKTHSGQPIPLVVFCATATFVMWIVATLGVVAEMGLLIPWAFGWTPGINVMLTRMFFWYFGHPLVYFWIMGAYIIWYNIIPTRYGGNVFSDGLTRLTFVMLILLSTPVGIHHEFMEPGISSTWKMLHTVLTYGVAIPSFITAFAIFASFELAAIKQGRRGFIATVKSLPWDDPPFSGAALGMLLFILGGFGGLVNASYSMDTVVHNTIWIVGHFHVTVGGPVALTFLGAAYWMIPPINRTRAVEAGMGALPDSAVVFRHADHVAVNALCRSARRAASHRGRRLPGRERRQHVGAAHAARCGGRVLSFRQHPNVRCRRDRYSTAKREDGINGSSFCEPCRIGRHNAADAAARFSLGRARACVGRPRVCRSARRAAAASGLPGTRNAHLVKAL